MSEHEEIEKRDILQTNFDLTPMGGNLYLIEKLKDDFPEAMEVWRKIENSKSMLELGPGMGFSTEEMLRATKNLEKLTTVDVIQTPDIKTEGLEYTHHKAYINKFLNENTDQFELAVISSVPDHNIQNYDNLFKSIKNGGIIIESVDTELNKRKMLETGFRVLLDIDEIIGSGNVSHIQNIVWIKPEETVQPE